jgi:hypothetical protein
MKQVRNVMLASAASLIMISGAQADQLLAVQSRQRPGKSSKA